MYARRKEKNIRNFCDETNERQIQTFRLLFFLEKAQQQLKEDEKEEKR